MILVTILAAVIFGGCVLSVVGTILESIFPDSKFIGKCKNIGLYLLMIGALIYLAVLVIETGVSPRNSIIVTETTAGIGCKVKSANVSLNGLNIRQIRIINKEKL